MIRRIAAVCLLFCTLLTGCQIGDKNIVILKPLGNKQLFQIGEMTCSVKEAKVYLANYQNIYGEAYTLDLWQHDFGNDSLENYIKTITLNELVNMVCMKQLADQEGLTLSDEEEGKIKEAAKEYCASLTKADKDYLGISESEVQEFYRHYALAGKVHNAIVNEIDDEVSDDEARVMQVMQIFVSDADTASLVRSKLLEGGDFAAIAAAYNELSGISANICRADLSEEVEQVVFQLNDNEVTDVIETEEGYYFIKCLNKFHPELTEANKEIILDKRRREAFDGVYNQFLTGLTSYLNEDVWEALEVDSTSGIETDQFFEIYEKHFI